MRANSLQALLAGGIDRMDYQTCAQLLSCLLIFIVLHVYSAGSYASENDLSGTWTGYDRSNFRGELRHISLKLSPATSSEAKAETQNSGPLKELTQPSVAIKGIMVTSKPAQRIRSDHAATVEQFDIAGSFYPSIKIFVLFFQAKGLYGSMAAQSALMSVDGGTMAFFPARGQPWLLTKDPGQHRKVNLLAEIEQAAPLSTDITSFKSQLLSNNTLPEQEVVSFLKRADALIEQHAQAVSAGDISVMNTIREKSFLLRNELDQARAASQGQQSGIGINRHPEEQGCPENLMAWADEVQAQGSSHQQYNGPAEVANLFRDEIFTSHFGAPFIDLEVQDLSRYGLQLSQVCSRNEQLRRSRLFPSMASAFKDPSRFAGAGMSRYDAASGALALEILDQWLERMIDQNLNSNSSYQAKDLAIILAELSQNLWPAKAAELRATSKKIVAEMSGDTAGLAQQATKNNPTTFRAGLQQSDKYQICVNCHETGVLNAPKLGDAESWSAPMASGIMQLVTSVKEGKGHMPAMGGCADCSDDEILQFIATMMATTISSSGSNQPKMNVSPQKMEAFLNRYGLYTMTLEEVWINNQKNQCGDLQPGPDLMGKFTNPNHPSIIPFTEEELTVLRALNPGRTAIGVKIQGENFFDLNTQKLLGFSGWNDAGIQLRKGKVREEDYDFIFLCQGTGTDAGKEKIANDNAQKQREECPLCELSGATYLDAIYRGDYQDQLFEGRSVLMSFARDQRSVGLQTVTSRLTSENELTLLEEVIGYYMLKYSLENESCFTEGEMQITFERQFQGYRIINSYGVEEVRVDPYTVRDVYRLPPAFEQACNTICNRQGGLSFIGQYLEKNDFTKEVGDVFSGISQLVEKHSCQSPIRKQFENNLLKLWQQEKLQPSSTRPTVRNALGRVQQLR